jgi:two-component system sensor histidine kinase DegS
MRALMDAQREIEQKALDLQQLLDRSVRVQEAERRRIAQEIHDGVTQMLVGSIYEMQAAKQMLQAEGRGTDGPQATPVRKINDALALASESVSEMRRVIFDLHPTILDELGLVAALQRLVNLSDGDSLRCTLHIEGAPSRLPAAHELALYRIAQEALNNVRQHANAQHARVQLRFERGATLLKVSDDGHGVGPTPQHRAAAVGGSNGERSNGDAEHLGLVGMRERAQSIGGQFVLESEPDSGTSISVTVPRPDERRTADDP